MDKANADLQREQITVKIKEWLKQAQTPFQDIVHPQISAKDIAINVKGKKEKDNDPDVEYTIILPSDVDSVYISTFLHFMKADNVGFKLLKQPDKVGFVNMLRIPLLTLNLNYTWIPDLKNFESLQIFKQIFFDGINKYTYFEGVSAVMHAYEIVLGQYQEFRDSISLSRRGNNDPSSR